MLLGVAGDHRRERLVTRRRFSSAISLALAVLIFDVAVLRWVGLSWGDQLTFLAALTAWSLAGHLILSRRCRVLADRFTAYAASVALGMTWHAGLCFVFFHTSVLRLTGLPGPRAAAQVAFALLLVPAFVEAIRVWRAVDARPWFSSTRSVFRIFALASIVALFSAFGFANNEARFDFSEDRHVSVKKLVESRRWPFATNVVPEWGIRQDRYNHVMDGPLRVTELGFPRAFGQGFQHYGVESLLAGLSLLRRPFSLESAVAFSKPLSLVWLFLIAYWIFLIARLSAGLSEGLAVLAAGSVLFYAALNAFMFWGPVTSYRIAPISGTLYHNVTQQASLAVGFGGLYLALLGLRGRRSLFPLGCLLIAGSLSFKPSLFTVVAPSLGVAAALQGRTVWQRDRLAGFGVLVAAVILWFVYPRLLHIDMLSAPIKPAFLPWHRFHAPARIAWPVDTRLRLALSVLLLSYAGFLLPMLALASPWRRLGPRLRAAFRQPDLVALTVLFALGLLSGLFLVEDNFRYNHGNFMWGYAVGHFTFLPFVALGLSRIRAPALRRIGWVIYVAHLVSGAWNLLLFAYVGMF